MTTIRIKDVRDEPAKTDGWRVLVDRLWPRGVSKERAALDDWVKDVAPSTELRKWFHGQPEGERDFAEFTKRYRAELEENPAAAEFARAVAEHDSVSLLFDNHDREHNNAAVLRDWLQS